MINVKKVNFKNKSEGKTPLNSTNLNLMQTYAEDAINEVDSKVEELLKEQNDDVKQFEYSSTLRNITFTIKLDKIGKIVVATLILDYSNTNDTLLGVVGNIPNFPSDFKCSKPKMLGGGSSIKSIGGAGITYAGNLEQLSDGNVKLTVSSLPETISGDTDNRQASCSWIYVID